MIGLGVFLAVIYGITGMLFQAKHEVQMQGYTHVLTDMMRSASERADTFEMLDKLACSAELRPGTHLVVTRADDSEFYRDPPASFSVEASTAKASGFLVTDKSTGDRYTGRLVPDCSQDTKTRQRLAILLLVATLAGRVFVAWATFWRVLFNLLGNAIRYAEPLTELCVHIEKTVAGEQRLWAGNTGPALPAAQLPRLFERFFCADASRCEVERPHHGLGLSIVAAIAGMHGGQPLAESVAGRTRVGLSLLGVPTAGGNEAVAVSG